MYKFNNVLRIGFLSYALIFVFLMPVNSYSQEILSKTSSCNFTIGDFVWNDTNGNGIQDAGEAGVPNVPVILFRGNGTALTSTITGSTGYYQFICGQYGYGDYYVQFVKPAGYAFSPKDRGTDEAKDSDADLSTGKTDVITISVDGDYNMLDAGIYPFATIGDFVWNDLNKDGIQDVGEPGLDNITVNLFKSDGSIFGTTTTNGAGYYKFEEVAPGDYYVQFVKPAGYAFSPKDQGGNDDKDSDADVSTGKTDITNLHAYEIDPSWDAGMYIGDTPQLASIGDFVWYDRNQDGVQGPIADEHGLSGITVNLYTSANVFVNNTITVDGLYSFTDIPVGDYYLEFILGTDLIFSPKDQGGDNTKDSDADPATGKTPVTTLTVGENDVTWDAGMSLDYASVGDFVWEDLNQNGVQDAGEPGLPNVTVELWQNAGSHSYVGNTTTNASGYYSFTGLYPGNEYRIKFILPSGYTFSQPNQGGDDTKDSDADLIYGSTPDWIPSPGDNNLTLDAGMHLEYASIGDFVWEETFQNGVQDFGESGISNVTVKLFNGSGSQVSSTTTNTSGYYLFDNIVPGDYFIEFVLPSNYAFTLQDQNGDDLDSDADPFTGRTITTSLIANENDMTWDAGMYITGPAEDCCDGAKPQILIMQYTGENCSATSHDQDPDKVGCSGDPGFDPNVYIIANDSDDHTSGNIWFAGNVELNGLYYIDATSAGETKLSSNTVVHIFDQQGGTLLQKVNFHTSCSQPLHENGDQWGANRLLGIIFDDGTNCGDLPDAASLGDFVWNDLNEDGIQNTGELGVSNVTVKLFNGSGSQVNSTTTNGSGYYLFDNLLPGDYFVEFVLPDGFTFSPKDQGGNDATDSDANTSTGRTITTTLIANEHDMTWDAGIYGGSTPDEDCCDYGGKPQILIMQYTGEDCSATHTTQDDGKYGCAGDPNYDTSVYIISNDNDDHTSGNIWFAGNVPLNGVYYIDAGNAGATQLENNTVIHVFDQQGGTLLQKVNFHTSCSQPLSEDDQWGANKMLGVIFDNGIDCGSIPASIGDFVWYDINNNGIQEAGEPGLPDVTVKLYTGTGTLVGTTTTNSNGYYLFSNLEPGNYFIEFTLLSGYTFSPKDQGSNDSKDSDANTTTGKTATTTLTAGETDLTWDAGMYTPPLPASLGDFVWFDTNNNGIQETGETGAPNVTVKLFNGIGVLLDTKITNASGYYLFDNLTPGDYFVEFTLLSGYTFSPKDQGSDDAKDSDANTTSGRTIVTTLTQGENDLSWDAGMYQGTPALASIGDFVWHDLDKDGIQDGGEPGLPDVTVKLYTSTGTLVGTTTTNSTGYYLFDGLTPGSYYLDFTLLPGYLWTLYDQGTNDAIDNDVDSPTSVTTLDPGENDMTWDAGMYIPSPDCTPPTSKCTLPASWNKNVEVTGTVNWSSLGIGDADDITNKIRLYGNGTVIVPSGDLKLKSSSAVLFIDGPTLIVEDGKVLLDESGANFTMKDGALMTEDNFEQKENTIVCITDSDVEIGEEMAGTDFRSGDSSEGDFKNDGGYRYLENNCINVTHYYVLTDKGAGTGINGVDVLIDNCIEVGDEGENHATDTPIGSKDDKDGGKWETKNRQYIFGTTIAIAKGDFTIDKNTLTAVDAHIKVNKDGDFEVKSDGTVDCGPICVAVEKEFKNDGTWLATGVTWYSKEKNSTNVPGAGPEEDLTTILSDCFDDCDCFPGEECYEGSIGDYVWYDENINGIQDDNFPSDPSHGIEDVKLTLYDGVGTPLQTTWTNAAGWYIFTNLAPGDYVVEVDPLTLPSELSTDPLGGTGVFQTYDYDGLATPNSAAVTLDFDCNAEEDCCVDGKPQKLTMRYTGEDCSATSHTQDPSKVNCTGDPGFDPLVYIIANDNDDIGSGNIWFFGEVPLGGEYVIDATLAGETKIGTNTVIHIYDQLGGTLLQKVNFHTSCSQPLNHGDQFGANKLLNVYTGTVYHCEGNSENLDVDFGYSDVPLPVTLSSFEVKNVNDGVEIAWVTESEIENQGFIIERRAGEEEDWQEIASFTGNSELKGQGTVTYKTEYSFIDNLVTSGFTYEYRLGDVDYNGVVTYHSTRTLTVGEIDESTSPSTFTVRPAYPNPFNPSTVIEYAIPKDGRVKVTIYDLMGQKITSLVNEEQIAGWHSVQWYGQDSHGISMPAGIYLISVNAGNSIKTMKLIFVK